MEEAILRHMEMEARQLEEKLLAIRSVIALYRGSGERKAARVTSIADNSQGSSNVEIVRRVAREAIHANDGFPVSTRDIKLALEGAGFYIPGESPRPQNIISSILSRAKDEFRSNGREGWTLVQERQIEEPSSNENEPPNGKPEGGSELAPEVAQ